MRVLGLMDDGGAEELFLAVRRGDIDGVARLVEVHGANVNAVDEYDQSPLYLAALTGNLPLCRFLLAKGARSDNELDHQRVLYAALNDGIRNYLRQRGFRLTAQSLDAYLAALQRWHDEGRGADRGDVVVFDVGEDTRVPCHRSVLAARCPYLARRFEGASVARIRNRHLAPSVFATVVQAMYTGRLLDIDMGQHAEYARLVRQCRMADEAADLVGAAALTGVVSLPLVVGSQKPRLQRDFGLLAWHAIPADVRDRGLVARPDGADAVDPSTLGFDVALVVEGIEFRAHSQLCQLRSEFLGVLMSGSFREARSSRIVLEDIQPEVMALVVDFLYTDRVSCGDVDPDLLVPLLAVASRLLLDGLKGIATSLLQPYVDADNVFDLLDAAVLFQAPRLEQMCIRVIAANISDLAHRTELRELIAESAASIVGRQEVDSVPFVDEVRTMIDDLYGGQREWTEWDDEDTRYFEAQAAAGDQWADEAVAKRSKFLESLAVLDAVLAEMGIEA